MTEQFFNSSFKQTLFEIKNNLLDRRRGALNLTLFVQGRIRDLLKNVRFHENVV